ncbi:MAG TPA: cytochrome C [Deltaproteobacteria bacterium]|nr:cytochrome C [Deltaproteobacteria bacterium]
MGAKERLVVAFIAAALVAAASLPWNAPALAVSTVDHIPIALVDEEGRHVLDSGKPYSPRNSCGNSAGSVGCHDYDAISSAYKFQMGRDEASDDFGKKIGLEHLVSPGYFGGYACMGGSNPEVLAKKKNSSEKDFADRGAAGWILRCSGCHPGGGWMEYDRTGTRYDRKDPSTVTPYDGDYYNRGTTSDNRPAPTDTVSRWDWKKSGVAENDCMICHGDFSALRKFDPLLGKNDRSDKSSSALDHFRTLRRTLASGGYFRYMASAVLEFINLNTTGDAGKDVSLLTFSKKADRGGHSRVKPAYKLDISGGGPIIKWNPAAFDSDRKVTIPMLRFSGNDNCMLCHRTSNSRRGFYGFGKQAEPLYSSDGTFIETYTYDVHKGKTWTEPNGESRKIDSCGACHARNYFRAAWGNTDLDADHNLMKGNSDMDARNDLDYRPNARSCRYCHNDAPNPAIPSGHKDMAEAHLERWRLAGDLAGYPRNELSKITRTHLDVISCQACHITRKKARGKPLRIMYRYRIEEDGALRIVPYNPRVRYYWKDKTSGHILTKTERDGVFRLTTDGSGKKVGQVVDPATGNVLATVGARLSHGSYRFGEPGDYDGYKALKQAYDGLLASKGYSNPDTVMVWIESNQYVMNHNTRSAASALQCAECHNRKQDGSFSSLVSPDGLLGSKVVRKITRLPDKRLVDEGVVVLGMPYMKVDSSGLVTENVSDILYESKIDPSLSILGAARATSVRIPARQMAVSSAVGAAGVFNGAHLSALAPLFPGGRLYLFMANYGDKLVRNVAVMADADSYGEMIFSRARLAVSLADSSLYEKNPASAYGALDSGLFSIDAYGPSSTKMTSFAGKAVVVKLPYRGTNTNLDEVRIVTSSDGATWSAVDKSSVLAVEPASNGDDGYIVFLTSHLSYYGIADSNNRVSPVSTSSSSSSGGGGCFIATAAFGSYEQRYVRLLRLFRDEVLLENAAGRAFVDLYYRLSPPLADWIADHDGARAVARVMLWPLIAAAWFTVKLGTAGKVMVLTAAAVLTASALVLRRRRAALAGREER